MAIKSFNNFLNEDNDLIGDLGSLGFDPYKGWVLCTQAIFDRESSGSSIWAVAAKSAGEAAVLIMENMGLDDEDDLETARKSEDFSGLEEAMENTMGFGGSFNIIQIFEGLKPKKNEDYALEIDWSNPYMAVKDLEFVFSNVREIMGSSN
jgi:hypothetical protein